MTNTQNTKTVRSTEVVAGDQVLFGGEFFLVLSVYDDGDLTIVFESEDAFYHYGKAVDVQIRA